jgi:phenylacetate-coenzyme A ligase PaaK-like adenylate-forming protein
MYDRYFQRAWDTFLFLHQVAHFNHVLTRPPTHRRQLQERGLRRLLRTAYDHSPYYREVLRGIDLRRCSLSDLPVLNKRLLMEHFDDIVTDRRLKLADLRAFMADPANFGTYYLNEFAVCQTSGTQGQPVCVVQNRDAFVRLFGMQIARGHSLPKTWSELGTRLVRKTRWVIFLLRPGFFPSAAAFSYMPEAVKRLAEVHKLILTDPWEENLARLNEIQPDFITGYTHVLQNLATAEARGQLRLRAGGHLKHLISMSEPLLPETKQYIEKHLGVPVSNHYAMAECMALTLGCPEGHGSHLNTDLAILEVLDRQGRPVPPGEPGFKVRVTNLYNQVQPFIRYEIDDVVTLSPTPCPCGSRLPLITSIAGRSNDRFWTVRGGEEITIPVFLFAQAFLPHLDMAEFQVTQLNLTDFHIKAAPLTGKSLNAAELEQAVQQRFASVGWQGWVQVTVEIVDSIPPDPKTGKLRRYINLMGAPKDRSDVPTPELDAAKAPASLPSSEVSLAGVAAA